MSPVKPETGPKRVPLADRLAILLDVFSPWDEISLSYRQFAAALGGTVTEAAIKKWPHRKKFPADVARLKQEDGPALVTQGSSDLIPTLLANDLIDEINMFTFPIVLGNGKKVQPEEVEAVLARSALLKEICVVGARATSGLLAGTEEICAVVVASEETGARYGGVLYVDSLSAAGGPVPSYLDLLQVTVETIAKGFGK